MKKTAILLAVIMLLSVFCISCDKSGDGATTATSDTDTTRKAPDVAGEMPESGVPSSGEDLEALKASYDRYPDFITAPVTSGNEIFVDPEDGRVMNSGTMDSPFPTIKQALLRCKPGDTIILRAGTYDECLYVATSGTEDAWITITSYKDEEVVFDDDNRGNSAPFNFEEGASYIRLANFEVRNYAGAGVWVKDGAHHIYIEDLYIHDISNTAFTQGGTEGILGQGDNVLVRNCKIENIGQDRMSPLDHGIYLGTPTNWVIDSNIIHTAPGGGIQQYAGDVKENAAHDVYIWNNEISDTKIGIILSSCENYFISNNTIANINYSFFFLLNYVHNCEIQNNIFYSDKAKGETYFAGKWDSATPTRAGCNAKMIEANADTNMEGINFDNNVLCSVNFDPVFYIKGMTKTLDTVSAFDPKNTYGNFLLEDPLFTSVKDMDFTLTDASPAKTQGISNEYTPEYNIKGEKRETISVGAY